MPVAGRSGASGSEESQTVQNIITGKNNKKGRFIENILNYECFCEMSKTRKVSFESKKVSING